MKTPFSPVTAAVLLLCSAVSISLPSAKAGGGSSSTLAVVYGSTTTICSIVAQQPVHQIQCWRDGLLLPPILPATSFEGVAGGRDILCGVLSGGLRLLCWDTTTSLKRIYNSATTSLTSLTIGDTEICALTNVTAPENAICWRPYRVPSSVNSRFSMISSGYEFSCGILENSSRVLCWGNNNLSSFIQSEFSNLSITNIQVGGRHACGIDDSGYVFCKGSNDTGQLNVPSNVANEYRALALGENHSCAIRRWNRTVICWGGSGEFSSNVTDGISFESIVTSSNFSCGLTTNNFSVICWGIGWPNSTGIELPLQMTLPWPCVETSCQCNVYPDSSTLFSGNGHICRSCDDLVSIPTPPPPFLPPTPVIIYPPSSSSRGLRRGLLALAIVGSVGGLLGICSVTYCLWTGVCFGKKKIHNSVQPTMTVANAAQQSSSTPSSRSSTLRRQGSILMRRQRSGTSSKQPERAEEFLFSELVSATNNFALENKIGGGSFGGVYKGKLHDGREVAVKRGDTCLKIKKFQEKESAFESELAILSRLHHKHLVDLIGYCEEMDERLLVYEYMKNGSLHDHLHGKNNVVKSSSVVNTWKMRIKISLDAARGIEYLHNYTVPPIIHRDIKSSNILLDANFTARVSDFGLSLNGPENDREFRMMKAAGTIGYIDPEYYGLNVLTAKSDVYGLGVVLLELLTGKKAIFKNAENGGSPISLVDYSVPVIKAGKLAKILDSRVGPPETNESEALELMANTAVHCVPLEGKDRLTMSGVVVNLERALALCDDSRGSFSSGPISILSD
ncbi:putative serine/threonine-protein kinase-like protein CCR3 [Primulina huaijiensis]|uniref:putative serine/threonine-protein kinase-like protein CCR3 n=1 Tax=Primulina huaijiensis TaxID=1492673 RepID=UPI003CC74569